MNYAELRGQLVVMMVLAVAIALRSMATDGGEPPRAPLHVTNADEVDVDEAQGVYREKFADSQGPRPTNAEGGPSLEGTRWMFGAARSGTSD